MRSYRNWLPALFIMLIIFISSSTTGTTIQETGLGHEKYQITGHIVSYFLLCIAFYKGSKRVLISVLLTILYGILDEFHQYFTYLRSPSLFDIKVDAGAALAAGLILWKLQAILPKKLKIWLKN